MEVCIFGVLTVNLLTFPSRNASLPSEHSLSRSPFSDGWLSHGRKSPNALLEPILQAYMMTGERHK